MHSFNGLVLVVLVIFHSVQDAVGINCYKCSDSRCEDPFDKGYNRDRTVPSSGGWCWKVKGEGQGEQVVTRGGDIINAYGATSTCPGHLCSTTTMSGVKVDVCCCNTDLCNGSQRINLTVSTLLTILLLIIRY